MIQRSLLICIITTILLSCNNVSQKNKIPVVGFLDSFEDATIARAKLGFFDALKRDGFSEEKKTIKVIYRNAQGDIPTLIQICDYFISENVDLIATNATLSTVTAVQKTKKIPICMMVAPRPDLAKITDNLGNTPANLFGVYETLDYIDTSLALIKVLLPNAKKIGAIYNQSEPQSILALQHIKNACTISGLDLNALPVNNSSETQLVAQSLINKGLDAFFALPDNTVFASFETIAKSCDDAKVPIFTSEAGLVKRGALAAFGADMYQWGFQAGMQASSFLKNKTITDRKPEIVKLRKKVFNPKVALKYSITIDKSFSEML